jgi:hypothetical protein
VIALGGQPGADKTGARSYLKWMEQICRARLVPLHSTELKPTELNSPSSFASASAQPAAYSIFTTTHPDPGDSFNASCTPGNSRAFSGLERSLANFFFHRQPHHRILILDSTEGQTAGPLS